MAIPTIRIAAAIVRNSNGEILLVRKRGTAAFMQPGGKIDASETASAALIRELHEELDLVVVPAAVEPLGTFSAPAAHEPGHVVVAELFGMSIESMPRTQAEIAEAIWVDPADPGDIILAPLTRDVVLPLCLSKLTPTLPR